MHWLAALILLAQLANTAWLPGAIHPVAILLPSAPLQASTSRVPAAVWQTNAEFQDAGVNYFFGEQIKFQARVQTDHPIREMLVYITPEGQQTHWQRMEVTETEDGAYLVTAQVDVRQMTLYPFSRILYYYEGQLEDTDVSKITSPVFEFNYDDNRFKWQNLRDSDFEVQWNGSDASLGQEILNIAEQGLQKSRDLLEATPPTTIRIYAYSSSRDLQSALQLTNQPWVAGHATPELAMIMISVPSGPEKELELQRQVPHEIMHILQYQVVGNKYQRQPAWLLEGMASIAELSSNPEYRRVLDASVDSKTLLPINTLCSAFPREASGAYTAYAQSESFVRFVNLKYGTAGLRKLIETYQTGVGCDEGMMAALGISLNQLDYRWQQEMLGIDTGVLVLHNLSPYLLVGLIMLIPAVLALIPFRFKKTAA